MLPSRLQQLRDRTVAAVDLVFAEPVKLSFLRNDVPDPERPACQINAVLRVDRGKDVGLVGRSGQALQTRFAADGAELHIDRATYSGPEIRKGDAVRALSRHGQPWFEVLRVDDRGDTRLVLELGEK